MFTTLPNLYFKDYALLVSIVFAVVMGAVYGGLVYMIQTQSAQADTLAGQYEQGILKEKRLEALKHVVELRAADLAKLDNYTLTEDAVVTLIERIESLGTHAGVKVQIDAAQVGDNQGGDGVVIDFASHGSFNDTFYFLSLIQALPLNMQFNSVQFNKSSVSDLTGHTTSVVWNGDYAIRILSLKK